MTADELWRHMPGRRAESVHLEEFPEVEPFSGPRSCSTRGSACSSVREQVNAALEQKRKDKVIGTSLGARVVLTASGPVARLLDAHRDDLPMLFIVSDLELTARAVRGARQRGRRGREGTRQ